MPNDWIALHGKSVSLDEEVSHGLSAYLVRGNEILGEASVQNNEVSFQVKDDVLAAGGALPLEIAFGPPALETFDKLPSPVRVAVDTKALAKRKIELQLPQTLRDQLADFKRRIAFICRDIPVGGTVVGPDGCPAPGAEVRVIAVSFGPLGALRRRVVARGTTDQNGQFHTSIHWCTTRYRPLCWPCWPRWWLCWPWWWERDMLAVIRRIDKLKLTPQLGGVSLGMAQPSLEKLARGVAFAANDEDTSHLAPDPERTALIRKRFDDPRFRALFPWFWWCCEGPNLVFEVWQNNRKIVDEEVPRDVRWCVRGPLDVTLTGVEGTITICPPKPQPVSGYFWIQVGATSVSAIDATGYSVGNPATDSSDMAFGGHLKIDGDFAAGSGVSFYQVLAGTWSNNPARGGAPPAVSAPISADFYMDVIVLGPGGVVSERTVPMGPFALGGQNNLYALPSARAAVPASALPPLPIGPGESLLGWKNIQRKVSTPSPNLIGGVDIGATTLSVRAFAFDGANVTDVALTPNTHDTLTLTIDNAPRVPGKINALIAKKADGSPADLLEDGMCKAYFVGPGGYVEIDVTVTNANGHLLGYHVSADYGHGASAPASPARGYRTSGSPVSPPPVMASGGYQSPDYAQRSFVGGKEILRFNVPGNCCYDFRLYAAWRVTDGSNSPTYGTQDFWTTGLRTT